MRGKAVGFYVRSSLHSCETSMCIYFAVLPYMSVYFMVVYCVRHDFLNEWMNEWRFLAVNFDFFQYLTLVPVVIPQYFFNRSLYWVLINPKWIMKARKLLSLSLIGRVKKRYFIFYFSLKLVLMIIMDKCIIIRKMHNRGIFTGDLCTDSRFHLMHLSSLPFSQNCASSRPSSSVGSSRPGSSPVPVVLDGHTVTTSHSSSSSTHSDNITQSFDKTSESLVYLLIQHQKTKHLCKGW